MRNLRKNDGFTLIELMIVVVIIGILAAIAIPKFSQVSKGAKESEALSVLKQIHTLEESYHLQKDGYATDLTSLTGWEEPNAKYYDFSVTGTTVSYCGKAAPNATAGVPAGLTTYYIKGDTATATTDDGEPTTTAC